MIGCRHSLLVFKRVIAFVACEGGGMFVILELIHAGPTFVGWVSSRTPFGTKTIPPRWRGSHAAKA